MQPTPVDRWDERLAHVVTDMQGEPLNVHKLLANNTALLNAWWPLRKHLVRHGGLDKRHAELVILRTAMHSRAWYEWASHVVRGMSSGLTLDEIERVLAGAEAPGWSHADACLLRAVDDLEQHRELTADTLAAIQQHLDSRQILELIALHGTYAMLGGILNTFSVELDAHVRDALPESVTETAFEGSLAP